MSIYDARLLQPVLCVSMERSPPARGRQGCLDAWGAGLGSVLPARACAQPRAWAALAGDPGGVSGG